MALKFRYGSRAEVPAELVAHVVEREGAFFLDVEGAVEKGKLDEFRTNNIQLKQQLEDARNKLRPWEELGLKADEAKKLADEKKALEEQLRTGSGGDIDKVIVARIKPLQDQLAAITAERDRVAQEARQQAINAQVLAAAQRRGLRASAQDDILLRASRYVRQDNGAVHVVDAGGQKRFGTDGVSPLTVDQWVDELSQAAGHLFENSRGGGADSGAGGARNGHGAHEGNPWKAETFNLTRQSQIMRDDPGRARQLAAQAGRPLAQAATG